jgi:hypothetical protein
MVEQLTETEKMFAKNVGCEVLIGERKGINLGLYFPSVKAERGTIKANGVNVYFPDKKKVYVYQYNLIKIINKKESTPAEIAFHLLAWLTTRNETLMIGRKHDTSSICQLAIDYCEIQGFNMDHDFNFNALKSMNNVKSEHISNE